MSQQRIRSLAQDLHAELRRNGRKVKFNVLLQALSKTLQGMPYQALLAKSRMAKSTIAPSGDVLLDSETDYVLELPEGQDRASVWIGAGPIAVYLRRTPEGVLVDLYKNGSEMDDSLAGTSLHVHDLPDDEDNDEDDRAPEAPVAPNPLKPYRVTLHEEPGDKFELVFDCMAEHAEHAYEQAENAYPGAEFLTAVETEVEGACPAPVNEEDDAGELVVNHYSCVCGHQWVDTWDCGVDDDCPKCGTTMTPFWSDDGSMPCLTDVAEWVSAHHKVYFNAEDGLSKRGWIERYIRAHEPNRRI